MKRFNKIILSINIIMLILLIIIIGGSTYMFYNHTLKYVPFQASNIMFSYQEYNLSKEKAVAIAREVTGVKCKVKFKDKLINNDLGQAVFYNYTAYIKNDLKGLYLLRTITHEMVHFKYRTYNERFTEFQTFKLLYESNNPIAHNAGVLMAGLCCEKPSFNKHYECSYYIIKYFNKVDYIF